MVSTEKVKVNVEKAKVSTNVETIIRIIVIKIIMIMMIEKTKNSNKI